MFYQKVFLPLASSDDFVIVNDSIPSQLQEHWQTLHWEFGQPISLVDSILPFINTDDYLIEFGKVHSLVGNELILDEEVWRSSAFLNSKIEQANYSKQIGYADEVLGIAHSPEDILEFSEGANRPIIIKEALNNSGKGHTVWQSAKDNYKLNRMHYPALMELYQPNRSLDFGILLQVTNGKLEYLEIAEMLIGKDFNYKGSFYYPQEKPDWHTRVKKIFKETYPFIASWQKFINSENYEGPISIDGFLCEDGTERIRSEINFRYTMGRIGYEIMQKRKSSQKWLENPPRQTGILLLHKSQKLEPQPDFELILSYNENDPWRIVYIEYRDQQCRSIL